MPSNATGTIQIWRDVTGVASVNLSLQETGVRVRAIPGGGAGTTVNLPTSTPTDGDNYEVIDADGSASPATPIVVVPPAGTTIRGGATVTIIDAFASVRVTFEASADDWTVEESAGGGIAAVGGVQEIRFPIGTGAAQSSTKKPPANSIMIDCELDIKVAYDAGTTIEVGIAASPALLMDTTANVPSSPNLYAEHQDTVWPAVGAVLVTIAGAPVAGSGFCIVRYVEQPEV
jgi:hypothetical protein